MGYHQSLLKRSWSSCSLSYVVSSFLFLLQRLASLLSFPSRFVARAQPVNEITRSNLWHQIPNENMIIVANAEYRARRSRVPRDRRRGQVGTMILSFALNRSFRTTQNRPYYRTKNSATQTRSYVLQTSVFLKCRSVACCQKYFSAVSLI